MMLNDDWVGNPPLQRASARKWGVIEFYHYEWMKSQAPVMFEYLIYYMIELLKTYEN